MKSAETRLGFFLIFLLIVTLVVSNTMWGETYLRLINYPLWGSSHPFTFITLVNDILMSFFFLFITLEIKQSMYNGPLCHIRQALLPCIAAIGGMIIPALIYYLCNKNNSVALHGWAIPTATDIIFALCFLSLFRNSIPAGLRDFLLVLAVVDDIGAIFIIAIFYNNKLAIIPMLGILICLVLLIWCNRNKIMSLQIYLSLGTILWCCVFYSGIHATIAGVILGFTIPIKSSSVLVPATQLAHKLKAWVNYLIIPLFIITNSAIVLTHFSFVAVFNSITLGIILGLFLGKQIGILFCSYLTIKFKMAQLPENTTWIKFYGVVLLTGIGFTMSLFIANLSFTDPELIIFAKLGVLLGSLLSAIGGVVVLALSQNKLEHS